MKLTAVQVAEIRRRGASGEPCSDISDALGVSGTTVAHVLKGHRHRIPGAEPIAPVRRESRRARGERVGGAKLRETEVLAIRLLWSVGVRRRALSRTFGVSESAIRWIVKRRTWSHVP